MSAGAAQSEADAEVSRRVQLVSDLTGVLAAMGDDEPLKAATAAALARAKESLETGKRAAGAIADVGARVAALQQSQIRNSQPFAEAARADLARRIREVGAYRAVGTGEGPVGEFGAVGAARVVGGLTPGGAAGQAPRGHTGGASWLSDHGLADVDVTLADYSDNPIVGKFGRGGCTRVDYRWAVTKWDEVIRPGLDRGLTRDDFVARDAACGARPPRSYAEVYDMFLGQDCIRIDRLPGGTLRVNGGRHRIAIARELGVTRLPPRWGG